MLLCCREQKNWGEYENIQRWVLANWIRKMVIKGFAFTSLLNLLMKQEPPTNFENPPSDKKQEQPCDDEQD